MNKIPKYKTKAIVIPQQPHYLKVNKKESSNETGIPRKITQKKLKFNLNSRQFGKDITITVKNNNKEESKKLPNNSISTNKVINIYNKYLNYLYRLKFILRNIQLYPKLIQTKI
jgi:hypothetical protein